MIHEIELRKNYLQNKKLKSLYFGGGTPSILSIKNITKLFNKINETFNLEDSIEITLECNPDDLSIEKLQFYKKIGINRLSIGIQSFKKEDLIFMNRSHTSLQAKQSVINAKKVGFSNISIDLIYSLPNQKLKDWKENLDIAMDLDIQHISAYSLTIEEKTKLKHLIKIKKITELNDDESSKHFDMLTKICKSSNFIQYEISNFGKKEFFSKHNSSYW